MATLLNPFLRALDANADAVSGGKLALFEAGTTTPVTTYSDSDMTTAQAQPLVANAAGEFEQSFVAAGVYKIRVSDSDDVVLYENDNVRIADRPDDPVFFNNEAAVLADTETYATGQVIQTLFDGKSFTAAASGATDNDAVNAGGQKLYRKGQHYSTTATLLASTEAARGTGARWSTKEGQNYKEAASGASDQSVTTAGGVKLYVLPGPDGIYNVKAFGALGDGTTDDVAAVSEAASLGARVWVPDGNYQISTAVSLANGTEFIGGRDAIITHTGENLKHFDADTIAYFAIRGITLKGNIDSDGATTTGNRGAIQIKDVTDFDIEFCAFEQHAGSGVSVNREGTTSSSGRVRHNTFIKGDMSATPTDYGTQDCAPLQIYSYSKNIEFSGNAATGKWYSGFFAQDLVNTGATRIYGLDVSHNRFQGLANYGIVLYTSTTLMVSASANNGSGGIRVTVDASHGLTTGDMVEVQNSATAEINGIWRVTVVDATNVDLDGAIYSSAASDGFMRMSENCAGRIIGNLVEDVEGDREYLPGNLPYGAGLYIQAAGGITAIGNIFRRCNASTNSETLTPGSIGVNGPTGAVNILGGIVSDSGYQSISIKATYGAGPVHIGGGIILLRCAKEHIRAQNLQNAQLGDIICDVGRVGVNAASGRVSIESSDDVDVNGLKFRNIYGKTKLLSLDTVTNFSVKGVQIRNDAPSTVTCEVAYFNACSEGVIEGCVFDGGDSAYTALTINGCTYTRISSNRIMMQPDGAARPTVAMQGTCTGSVFERTNDARRSDGTSARMLNSSTGGKMHTRANSSDSGGKTRQIGDTIENTEYADTEALFWVKTAVSSGGSDWNAVIPA